MLAVFRSMFFIRVHSHQLKAVKYPQELNDAVFEDCLRESAVTKGRVIVIARLLEQAIKEAEK